MLFDVTQTSLFIVCTEELSTLLGLRQNSDVSVSFMFVRWVLLSFSALEIRPTGYTCEVSSLAKQIMEVLISRASIEDVAIGITGAMLVDLGTCCTSVAYSLIVIVVKIVSSIRSISNFQASPLKHELVQLLKRGGLIEEFLADDFRSDLTFVWHPRAQAQSDLIVQLFHKLSHSPTADKVFSAS